MDITEKAKALVKAQAAVDRCELRYVELAKVRDTLIQELGGTIPPMTTQVAESAGHHETEVAGETE